MKSLETILCVPLVMLCLKVVVEAEPLQLDANNFQKNIESGKAHFVKFYAPWCGHCKKLAPTWDELADKLDDRVIVAKVDCTTETKLCAEQEVRGYPTLKLFTDGQVLDYRQSRDINSLVQFAQSNIHHSKSDSGSDQEAADIEVQVDSTGLAHLTDDNFDAYLTSRTGVHFIKFYAPWCGHCQRLAPTWDELATHFKSHHNVHISKVDCTKHSSTCQQHGVRGYPTLLLFEDSLTGDKYSGTRDLQDMITFVNSALPAESEERGVVALSGRSFADAISSSGLTFVKFYAPWCGHCKQLAPTWDKLPEHVSPLTTIAKVDCTEEQSLCSDEGVHSYPTLVLYQAGQRKAEHHGSRELNSLLQFIAEHQ